MKSCVRNIKYTAMLFVSAMLLTIESMAQDNEKVELSRCSRFELGYIFGGMVYNDNFMYNPGVTISHTYDIKVNKKVGYGVGLGAQLFEDERFIPIYADFVGQFKKNNSSPYLNVQLGYSIGWNEKYERIENNKYRGGLMFASGVGKRFGISDKFSMLASFTYKHQVAQLKYVSFEGYTSKERLNYDFFILSIGIILEQ